jgi:hypothetical protein
MPTVSISYRFCQHFAFSAEEAFAWAVDYQPYDIELLGKKGKRSIKKLTDDSLILTDRFETPHGIVRKHRLVSIFRKQMTWTNTHLAGPIKHSQFHYQIVAEGPNRSRLDFVGLHLENLPEPASKQSLAAFAKKLAKEDAELWKNLARAMAKDLGTQGSRKGQKR